MSNINSAASYKKQDVLEKSWSYLSDNFHKFSDETKLRVSMSMALKSMPTIVEGDVGKQMNITNMVFPKDWKPKEERSGLKPQDISS